MFRRIFLVFFLSFLTLLAFNQTRNLEFYLDQGIHNSPLLNDYRNQIRSASSDSLLIRAAKNPLVEVKSQLLYAPSYRNFGYDEIVTDQGNYTAVMGISQPLFNKREINNKYEALDIQKRTLNNSSQISINELKKVITEQYLTSFASYTDFLFNRNFLELKRKCYSKTVCEQRDSQTDRLSFFTGRDTVGGNDGHSD